MGTCYSASYRSRLEQQRFTVSEVASLACHCLCLLWKQRSLWGLSRRLKLLLSAKHQIAQIVTQWVPGSRASNSKCPTSEDHTCWDYVAAQPSDDDWRNGTWTFRTLDCSCHHWTIRTVMQDSQKLTFLTKMCLCSVWVSTPPPWFFLTFSPNGWDFLVQILLSDYTFLSTLDYKFLFNYLQLW